MAKTDITREIEKAIKDYHPAELSGVKVNKFRGEHTALEVPVECGTTSSGIIDAVRISEYFGDKKTVRICRPARWRKDGMRGRIDCTLGLDTIKELPDRCDCTECRWNYPAEEGTQKILLTCFEIKVTKSDFKSKHGHNFVGNLNYYAVPEELYPEIKDMVPEGIGILAYLHKGLYQGLRVKKRSEIRELSDEDQKWLILSVLKRIRDMDYEKYKDWMERHAKSANDAW